MKSKVLRQIITMSKYAFYGICMQCLVLSLTLAKEGVAQSKSVEEIYLSVNFQNNKIEDAFAEISAKTSFDFIYNNNLSEKKKDVSLKASNESLGNVLRNLSKQTGLQFKRVDQDIIVIEGNSGQKGVIEIMEPQDAIEKVDITGTITDENGEGLPGASIIEKGTTNGSTTDFSGNFSLSIDENSILIVSFIGYETQEISLGGQSILNIQMVVDAEQLAEVVVIGYGVVEKADVTGAISSIKAKDFNRGVISSPEQLIQGRTTGVQISTGSGEPGSAVNVRIRGTSSIRSGNNPLYVIDGVPLNGGAITPPGGANAGTSDSGSGNTTAKNPLNFLAPGDIISIDVLKDASATAIYGSRGANGVILITTKRGKEGKGQLQYSASVSVSKITKKLDLLSPDEFRSFTDPSLDFGSNTDWQDVIFRTALSQRHNVTFGGGTKSSRYSFSTGFVDQQGIVEESGMKRYTAGLNADFDLLDDKLHLMTTLKVANILDKNPQISNDAGFTGDLLSGAWRANPTRPIFNSDGTYAQPDVNERNPAAILNLSRDETNTLRVLGSFSATYDITKDFSYKLNFGVDESRSERKSALSGELNIANIHGLGRADFAQANSSSTLIEHTLNYTKKFNSGGKINVLAGFSYQEFKREARSWVKINFT